MQSLSGTARDSNPGPLGPKSNTLPPCLVVVVVAAVVVVVAVAAAAVAAAAAAAEWLVKMVVICK